MVLVKNFLLVVLSTIINKCDFLRSVLRLNLAAVMEA